MRFDIVFMPELPEVETIRKDLEGAIVGAIITDIWTDTPKMLSPSFKSVKAESVGKKIVAVKRRAKVLMIDLEGGKCLLIHLKLSGRILLRKPLTKEDIYTHIKIILKLKDGSPLEFRFCDLRKFGYVKLANDEELKKVREGLGPEPLDDLTLEYFQKTLAKSGKPVKTLLMDQEKFSGIGNIYANEAFFAAKVLPMRPAKSLSAEESEKLFNGVLKVIKEGLDNRGTTAKDDFYLDAFGRAGNNESNLKVYQKNGTDCLVCKGKIQRVNLGGRGTFFCPNCQH